MSSDAPPDVLIVPCAQWTDDCQGKKNYDGRLLSISTSYRPAELSKDNRPSARSSIHLDHGKPDSYGYGYYLNVAEQEFVADTEAEVKAAVEVWVQAQFDRIVRLLGMDQGTAPIRVDP
jgi:hypothetical protein